MIQQLEVTEQGRSIFLGDMEDAFAWGSVLSLPVALDGIVPLLEGAVQE